MPAKPELDPKAPSALHTLARRRLFAGAGTAAALATAATVLPSGRQDEPQAAAQPAKAPEAGGGYQLTAHVQRYYQTTKV